MWSGRIRRRLWGFVFSFFIVNLLPDRTRKSTYWTEKCRFLQTPGACTLQECRPSWVFCRTSCFCNAPKIKSRSTLYSSISSSLQPWIEEYSLTAMYHRLRTFSQFTALSLDKWLFKKWHTSLYTACVTLFLGITQRMFLNISLKASISMVELLDISTDKVLFCREFTIMSLSNSHWIMIFEIRFTIGHSTWG